MRTTTLIALTAATALGLSACGGSEPLTQEQTRDALLTESEFPLDGFTAGTITEHDGGDDSGDSAGDLLAGFPGAEELDQECQDALSALSSLDADFEASSSLDFTGSEGDSPFGAPEVTVVVASMKDGDNPLDTVEGLNSACEEVTIEEEGMSMTMKFEDIDGDAQGTKITMEVMGQSMELAVAGRENGGNYAIATGMGVSDDEVIEVLDAQESKISDL
ncbi:hypothetical protein FNH13_01785 [Ornithinimicrobium ciconiae]|uniref:DUF5642 domain-containing protein n=1 Tax=Ornithinimicrobium ciconiae TaxID=2594265 RepID=A0A516G6Q3_9MICO|nr:hypothetical protein [Ornithinimicrobium ciconiae]QDO87211.1 hypothetical protein FNH13_01785 [Ornithinimicrobium ciconiae]